MSFTYSLSTDIGKVRLKIGDTSSSAYIFEDDEITQFLTDGGSVTGGVIEALRTLYIDRAKRAKFCTLPGMSFSDTAALTHLREALKMYGADLPTVTVVMPSVLPMDSGFEEPTVTYPSP